MKQYSLFLVITAFICFNACKSDKPTNPVPTPEKVVTTQQESKVKSNSYDIERINTLMDKNESQGLADANQGRKDTIIKIIKALNSYDHEAVATLAKSYLAAHQNDEDVAYLYNSSLEFSARSNKWVGGTPGKANLWNEPRNWEKNEVPDEDTRVIIKKNNTGHGAQPVITDKVTVNAIEIYPNATLSIAASGNLVIDGETFYSEGISILGGKIDSKGKIVLRNIDKFNIDKTVPMAAKDGTKEFYSEKYGYQFSISD